MKKWRSMRYPILVVCIIFFGGCEDSFTTRNQHGVINEKTFGGGHEGPGGYTDHPNGDRYQYPKIIKKEFIPPNSMFDYMKCLAWRIEWPEYAESADENKIPTVFGKNGALNSFYYLNNVHPQNTYNGLFSLYYDEKVISANNLWYELDYSFDAPTGSMESITYAKVNFTENVIKVWVTERPQLFEQNWPGSIDHELEYSEGDFFIFKYDEANYGGIRIVSTTPRVIEVYMAVPND
jgi:hypothetical protein